jgi:hypothetical protein
MEQEAGGSSRFQGVPPSVQDAKEAYLGSEMPRVPAAIHLSE